MHTKADSWPKLFHLLLKYNRRGFSQIYLKIKFLLSIVGDELAYFSDLLNFDHVRHSFHIRNKCIIPICVFMANILFILMAYLFFFNVKHECEWS